MIHREKCIARDFIIVGIAIGFIIGLICGLVWTYGEDEPTRAELQREFDAYRACMQSAGQMRCSMQPSDFVRYYEIMYQLEQQTIVLQREN